MSIRGREKLKVDARNRQDVILTMCREIMSEKPWLPIYEDGGVDALIRERLIPREPPPPSWLPNPGSPIR